MKRQPRKLDVTIVGTNGTFDAVNLLAGAVRFGERNVASIQDLAVQTEAMCLNGIRLGNGVYAGGAC